MSPFSSLELSFNYSHLNGEFSHFTIQNPFGQFDCSGAFVTGTVNLSCMPFSLSCPTTSTASRRATCCRFRPTLQPSVTANYAYTGQQWETATYLPQYEPGSNFPSFGLLNLHR